MDRKTFSPPHLLKHFPVPNFHWGLRQNGFVFLAGQGGIDHDGKIPASLADQTRLALANVQETLAGLDASDADIVQMMIFFKHVPGRSLGEALTTFVEVKDQVMPNCVPVGLAVPVIELFMPDLLVEVQVIAAVRG